MLFQKTYDKGFQDGENNFLDMAAACIRSNTYHNFYTERFIDQLTKYDLEQLIKIKEIREKYDRKESV